MRILQLTKKVPYPYHDGESWAVRAIAEGLHHNEHRLSLIALNTDKHHVSINQLEEFRKASIYKSVETIDIATKENATSAISNLFSSASYHIQRYENQAVNETLKDLLLSSDHIDVVIFESLFVMPYFETIKQIFPHCKTILRAHNVEHEVWRRIANQVSPLAKWYFKAQADRLKKYEKIAITKVDLVAAVSPRDQDLLIALSGKFHIKSIPIGIKAYPQPERTDYSVSKIGFIGTLDWRPNLLGIRRLINDIWPTISSDKIELHIAGRGSEVIKSKDDRIFIHGRVENSNEFLQGLDAAIVPLWSGSGTRVKILEAMSLGVPVISTTMGAEGIAYTDDQNILIADTKEEWQNVITKIQSDNLILNRISHGALDLIKKNHDITKICQQLIKQL